MFRFWFKPAEVSGRNIILFSLRPKGAIAAKSLSDQFKTLGPIQNHWSSRTVTRWGIFISHRIWLQGELACDISIRRSRVRPLRVNYCAWSSPISFGRLGASSRLRSAAASGPRLSGSWMLQGLC